MSLIADKNNIFLFWDSGFDSAPELIQSCLKSWQFHHKQSNWKIHALCSDDIGDYLPLFESQDREALMHQLNRIERGERCGDIVKFTDLLRLVLLDTFGGVWADATVFCLKPLNEWIDLDKPMLFAPESRERNRRHEAWFLVNMHQHLYLTHWKVAFRSLIVSGVDFCDDWKFSKSDIVYWMRRVASASPEIAARIWNSWYAIRVLKKQPYFSINYCAEAVLQKNHSDLIHSKELFLEIDSERCCPNKLIMENPDDVDFSNECIVKLNHKWESEKLVTTLKKQNY